MLWQLDESPGQSPSPARPRDGSGPPLPYTLWLAAGLTPGTAPPGAAQAACPGTALPLATPVDLAAEFVFHSWLGASLPLLTTSSASDSQTQWRRD